MESAAGPNFHFSRLQHVLRLGRNERMPKRKQTERRSAAKR